MRTYHLHVRLRQVLLAGKDFKCADQAQAGLWRRFGRPNGCAARLNGGGCRQGTSPFGEEQDRCSGMIFRMAFASDFFDRAGVERSMMIIGLASSAHPQNRHTGPGCFARQDECHAGCNRGSPEYLRTGIFEGKDVNVHAYECCVLLRSSHECRRARGRSSPKFVRTRVAFPAALDR